VRALHKDFSSGRRRKIGGGEQKRIRVKETAARGFTPPDEPVRVDLCVGSNRRAEKILNKQKRFAKGKKTLVFSPG